MTKITLSDAVMITKEAYDQLMKDSSDLAKLHAGGVDNWVGYDESLYGDEEEEKEEKEDDEYKSRRHTCDVKEQK
jgi:hypothetical protein